MALWSAPIDLYCERVGAGLWAEPLNAWSNLAFPAAAAWAWSTARARDLMTGPVALLIALAALIGAGSWLFHVFANGWSELADVIPIWSFVALYVLTSVHMLAGVPPGRLLRIGVIVAAVVVIVTLATSSGAGTEGPGALNGSVQYAPALLALIVLSALTLRSGHPIRWWALGATLAFLGSLTFRTLDLALCPVLPMGPHFLWHLLNGLMVGLLLQGLIRTAPRPR